jgi:hypothetical protein
MSPKCVNVLVGAAWLMWLAPAFHRGPRPLKEEAEARTASIPRRQSSRRHVCGRFHTEPQNAAQFDERAPAVSVPFEEDVVVRFEDRFARDEHGSWISKRVWSLTRAMA